MLCIAARIEHHAHVRQAAHLARGLGASAGGLALHIGGSALCLASRIVSSAGDLVQNAAQVGGSILSLHSTQQLQECTVEQSMIPTNGCRM